MIINKKLDLKKIKLILEFNYILYFYEYLHSY